MKKNGFTLIELLAVIVILAIIALIATPIILNIINDSKIESEDRSSELYIDAVELAIADKNLDGEFNPSVCNIQSNGNIKCDGSDEEIVVSVDGTKPDSGIIIFKNNKVEVSEIGLGDTIVSTTSEGTTQVAKTALKKYNNGDPVYFNVTTGEKCTASEAVSTTGTKSGCMKFYAFNDTEGSYTLNLLLDHNTTATVAWVIQEDYEKAGGTNWSDFNEQSRFGPLTLLRYLQNDTSNWKGTLTPTTYDNGIYSINYNNYKARLISLQELSEIVQYSNFDEKTQIGAFYFDSLTATTSTTCKSGNTTGCKYGWLYDRTGTTCKNFGCYNNSDVNLYGYWTVSKVFGFSQAWSVRSSGMTGLDVKENSSYQGVRPVIEVLKSKLS